MRKWHKWLEWHYMNSLLLAIGACLVASRWQEALGIILIGEAFLVTIERSPWENTDGRLRSSTQRPRPDKVDKVVSDDEQELRLPGEKFPKTWRM